MSSPGSPSPDALRVVLIDHGLTTRHSPAPILRGAGHCVFSAYNGLSALALLEQYPGVELLITKPRSGDLNGSTLISQARRLKPTIAILHIGDVQGGSDGVPSDVSLLAEPFTPQQLLTTVVEMVTRARGR